MSELSVFIDESGDFGETAYSPRIILSHLFSMIKGKILLPIFNILKKVCLILVSNLIISIRDRLFAEKKFSTHIRLTSVEN